jgi:hypothetical protein
MPNFTFPGGAIDAEGGIEGCHRRRPFRTTQPAVDAEQVPDLVQRQFSRKVSRAWITSCMVGRELPWNR